MLELGAALALLLAAWPLCAAQPDVKERLILVLRKAMFQPDLGGQLTFALGIQPRLHGATTRTG